MKTIPYRKAYEVIGYAYYTELFCKSCGDSLPDTDPEGNDKHPVFLFNVDDLQGYHCSECESEVDEWN